LSPVATNSCWLTTFTGTVDSGDLEPDTLLFPRVGGGGKKKDDSITNKSELLFLWLMLDLLDIGGRCAVITQVFVTMMCFSQKSRLAWKTEKQP
jgi:hypothetical protein